MTSRVLIVCLAVVAALALLTGPGGAQDVMKVIRGNYDRQKLDWFQYNFGLGGRREAAPPQQQLAPKPKKPRARVSPFEAPRPAQDIAEPAEPKAPPSIFVDVIGDSLAELLADGLKTQLADRSDIAVQSKAKSSSGFVRTDYYDWSKAVSDLLASGDKIDAVVIMMGINDGQQLKDGDATYELRSDGWKTAYVKRIDGILAQLKARNVRIYWVGLPPMKSDKLTADVVWFNEIYRDRTEAAGGTYLDIWDGFADADGAYTASGPDINGQIAKLRAGDGVHFSKAGALLAAHYPERELRRAFGDAPIAAAPTMTSPLAPAEPTPGPGGVPPVASLPGEPAEPAEPEKPEYGPVMPLETQEVSPGGVLLGGGLPTAPAAVATAGAGASPLPTTTLADPTAQKVLVRGEPLAPKEGRSDDFRWPRTAAADARVKTSSVLTPAAAAPAP